MDNCMNHFGARTVTRPFGRILLSAIFLFLLCAPILIADEGSVLDKPQAVFEAKTALIQKTYKEENPARISDRYSRFLSRYMITSRADGKLREYLAAQKELKRFKKSGTVEEKDLMTGSATVGKTQMSVIRALESNQQKMLIEETQLRQTYIRMLGKLKKSLTRQDRIDEAIRVEEEIEMVSAFLDLDVLAPTPPAQENRRRRGRTPSHTPVVSQPLIQKLIAEDRIVVAVSNEKGPVSGLNITLKSHTFNKTLRGKTDRRGEAKFRIQPELEYYIRILDPKYEPVIRPHCVGGDSYAVELLPMPKGVEIIEMPTSGDFKLPGISNIRVSGYSSLGAQILGILVRPTSFRTTFSGHEPMEESVTLELDTWITVAERSHRAEIKIIAPDSSIRLIFFRKLPPADADESGAKSREDESRLVVQTQATDKNLSGIEVVLTSHADGKTLSKKNGPDG